jgi:hypothetical protein
MSEKRYLLPKVSVIKERYWEFFPVSISFFAFFFDRSYMRKNPGNTTPAGIHLSGVYKVKTSKK